ncbi:MAG: hypothetical protein AB7E49_11675 [Campylobacterales bacterium]
MRIWLALLCVAGLAWGAERYFEPGFETVTEFAFQEALGEVVPRSIVLDPVRGAVVSDEAGHRLLSLAWGESQWRVLAGFEGYGDRNGIVATARFALPQGVAIDTAGDLYVADAGNQKIRKMIFDGNVSTVAGSGEKGHQNGPAASARFDGPSSLIGLLGGGIAVADTFNHKIRRIDASGEVSDFAGGEMAFIDGAREAARFAGPADLALDAAGNLYVADTFNHAVRKVSLDGWVQTLAGAGVAGYQDGKKGSFNYPLGLAWHPAGFLLVADSRNHALRVVAADGSVRTAIGAKKPGEKSPLKEPTAVAVDSQGRIFLLDSGNRRLLLVRYVPN